MYNKENENYDLYLAGLISENKYYELCEASKKSKNKKTSETEPTSNNKKDVTGDGKSDFADVMASRMIAGGMDKEKAIKKAHEITNKHKKKKKKKMTKYMAKGTCYEAAVPDMEPANKPMELKIGHGLDVKFKNFIKQLNKSDLARTNLKNLAINFIFALHDAMVADEKISEPTAKSLLMKDIKAAFMQADKELQD